MVALVPRFIRAATQPGLRNQIETGKKHCVITFTARAGDFILSGYPRRRGYGSNKGLTIGTEADPTVITVKHHPNRPLAFIGKRFGKMKEEVFAPPLSEARRGHNIGEAGAWNRFPQGGDIPSNIHDTFRAPPSFPI